MSGLHQNVFHLTFSLQLLPAPVLIFDIHDSSNHSGALKKMSPNGFKILTLILFGIKYKTLCTLSTNQNVDLIMYPFHPTGLIKSGK